MAGGDARVLIEQAVRSFLEEVPALVNLKMVVGVDLIGGRSGLPQFRLVMPDVTVTKDIAADARVRLEMRREFFNAMVENDAKVADWREAFTYGQAKAQGVGEYLRLIRTVVEKQEERTRSRRARH